MLLCLISGICLFKKFFIRCGKGKYFKDINPATLTILFVFNAMLRVCITFNQLIWIDFTWGSLLNGVKLSKENTVFSTDFLSYLV